jgi:hypothetical protein
LHTPGEGHRIALPIGAQLGLTLRQLNVPLRQKKRCVRQPWYIKRRRQESSHVLSEVLAKDLPLQDRVAERRGMGAFMQMCQWRTPNLRHPIFGFLMLSSRVRPLWIRQIQQPFTMDGRVNSLLSTHGGFHS